MKNHYPLTGSNSNAQTKSTTAFKIFVLCLLALILTFTFFYEITSENGVVFEVKTLIWGEYPLDLESIRDITHDSTIALKERLLLTITA